MYAFLLFFSFFFHFLTTHFYIPRRKTQNQINRQHPDRYFRMKLSHIGSDVHDYVIDGKHELMAEEGVRWGRGWMRGRVRSGSNRVRCPGLCERQVRGRCTGFILIFSPAWPPFTQAIHSKIIADGAAQQGLAEQRTKKKTRERERKRLRWLCGMN